ncbi:MAG TPA: single-stranded-DNA-specific exonuclease RecJ [Terriglobales bacterium]|nr:single-stranded-DNA-specific exonuclease RecJ [Terriglobales bacterium]
MKSETRKRWIVKRADPALVERNAEQLKISPLLARLIALRGITEAPAAASFLSSSLRSDLPSPFLMRDMEAAVERIMHALQRQELICVWGDYDVDGTTGTAVLVAFLREIGAQPLYHIPHRIDEGYGLNIDGLRRLRERGVRLVVTVDCGISNAHEIEAAKSLGLDVVVVDHHQPPEVLPLAAAVVDPHRQDCLFPDKGLCAAGLAFYLVIALRARLREAGWFKPNEHPDVRRYLDIVTLGTIADMVPLRGVNRTLIRRGLWELGGSARPGIHALKEVAHITTTEISAGQVGFQLGPRINAAGRVDYGFKVVELLTTTSSDVALRIARELDEHNRERRALEAEVLAEAAAMAKAHFDHTDPCSIVVTGEKWHPGVLGIVASRIVERFYRPTVIIGFAAGQGKGSARSIHGFHMVEAFRRCADHLEKFGGHEFAGGLSIRQEKVESFTRAFEAVARESLTPVELRPCLEMDAQLNFGEINIPLVRNLERLRPFGIGNPEPLFMTASVEVCERRPFSAGVRFRFRQENRVVAGVIFGGDEELPIVTGTRIDLAYRVTENRWNGTSAVELRIVDARPAEGSSQTVNPAK